MKSPQEYENQSLNSSFEFAADMQEPLTASRRLRQLLLGKNEEENLPIAGASLRRELEIEIDLKPSRNQSS